MGFIQLFILLLLLFIELYVLQSIMFYLIVGNAGRLNNRPTTVTQCQPFGPIDYITAITVIETILIKNKDASLTPKRRRPIQLRLLLNLSRFQPVAEYNLIWTKDNTQQSIKMAVTFPNNTLH